MPEVTANGLRLHYDTFGNSSDRALILIMGLGAQMLLWRDGFCQALAERGHYVVRFDNRDIGLSEHLDHLRPGPLRGAMLRSLFGLAVEAPYSLSDMAADVMGILDGLGIDRAHVCGASMGGMIAQTCALEHPSRCASLISIMSNTGEYRHRFGRPAAMLALLRRVEPRREAVADNSVRFAHAASGPAFDVDEAEARHMGGLLFDRSFHPAGFKRQLLAVLSARPRTRRLRRLEVPTLVIHGTHDPVVRPAGGSLTARSVPGSQMFWVRGMGHRLPREAWPQIADAIQRHTAMSDAAGERH